MARLLFIAAFFGLLLLPLAQMATGFVSIAPVDENRRPAAPPSAATPLDQIPRVADQWFSDHFGLRPWLIRAKAQIDYSVFGTSERVLSGSDGQLFYRSTVNVEAPAVEKFLAANEVRVARGLAAFAQRMQERGVRVVVTVNLMSDRFYPELLPNNAIRRPAQPGMDRLTARLAAMPEILFVDSTAILKATQQSRRIFHKTDFHWNDPAAYDVAKAVVDRIAAAEGRPASPWAHPLEIEQKRFSGGIATFMPLFIPPSETGLFVRQTWPWPAGLSQAVNVGLFEHTMSFAPSPTLLPPVMIVGDSFVDAMLRNGVQAYFEKSWRIRWRPNRSIDEISQAVPPGAKWVVVQFIEVSLTAMEAFAANAH